uniref:Uncharacterized protein n=1 Tax=Opuntia streptacantha TaxID=393608 RepID=A0A7C8ZCQ4_OPUST
MAHCYKLYTQITSQCPTKIEDKGPLPYGSRIMNHATASLVEQSLYSQCTINILPPSPHLRITQMKLHKLRKSLQNLCRQLCYGIKTSPVNFNGPDNMLTKQIHKPIMQQLNRLD